MVPPLDPGPLVLALGTAALAHVAARRVPTWPGRRQVAAVGAAVALVAAAFVPDDTFTGHGVQHLLVGMVAPVLLALAGPVTVLLQAVPRHRRRAVLGVVHSRIVSLATHPIVALALFVGSLVAVYLGPVYGLSVRHPLVHAGVHVHLLVSGWLFFAVVVGTDPLPVRLPPAARVAYGFLAIPAHAVVGIALLSARAPIDGVRSLSDQRDGASVLWAGGDLLGLLVVLVAAARWAAVDEREAGLARRG